MLHHHCTAIDPGHAKMVVWFPVSSIAHALQCMYLHNGPRCVMSKNALCLSVDCTLRSELLIMADLTHFLRFLVGLDVRENIEGYGGDAENVLPSQTRVERMRRLRILLENQNRRRSEAMFVLY